MNDESSLNPYAPPPPVESSGEPIVTHDVNIHVRLLRRRWTSIELALAGDLDATLSYHTLPANESVRLNGKTIAKAKGLYISAVCPRIDFVIPLGDQVVPATIFAKASYIQLVRLTAFRLHVDGTEVYQYGG